MPQMLRGDRLEVDYVLASTFACGSYHETRLHELRLKIEVLHKIMTLRCPEALNLRKVQRQIMSQ